MSQLRAAVSKAKKVVVLTGAGVSAESGIPTFRSASGGLWRDFDVEDLATPTAFASNPGRVWAFYHWRRSVVASAAPNPGHHALAELEAKFKEAGREFTVVTQNIDRLHQLAGSKSVLELHGSLWLLKRESEDRFCELEGRVWEDRTMPLTPALAAHESATASGDVPTLPDSDLPHLTEEDGSESLLRPAVVWFGENLDDEVLTAANDAVKEADVLLVCGTSSVVYPAAGLSQIGKQHGATVAELNMEDTPVSPMCDFAIRGKSGDVLPELVKDLVLE